MHQRERGIVADRADVAEMIGEPLQFGHQRAQIDRARRQRHCERGLGREREGIAISHRAVAGGARRQPRGVGKRRARHQALDALVHIAEPLFEPHHEFAVGGETEMAGLDNAGMHRADRDLVQRFAFGRQEMHKARSL